MSEGSKRKKMGNSFNTLFKVFLKTGKRRIFLTIITSVLAFTLLISFLMAWFNYQNNYFIKTVERDWYDDGYYSIDLIGMTTSDLSEYPDYFNLLKNEAINKVQEIMPYSVKNYTAAMAAAFFYFPNISELGDFYFKKVLGIAENQIELLSSNLINGRLPKNETEILYLTNNITHPLLAVNDTVHLKVNSAPNAEGGNYTISGILYNTHLDFYNAGFSSDIFDRDYNFNYQEGYYDIRIANSFITIVNFIPQILDQYSNYENNIQLIIDIEYDLPQIEIRKTKIILDQLEKIHYLPDQFVYFSGFTNSFCDDLIFEMENFLEGWMYKTVIILASAIPLIFIFALICTESFHIGDFEKETKFNIIKIHGLEFNTLKRMLFLENLIITSLGFTGGFILGILIGYLVAIGMGTINFGLYLSVLKEPIIITAMLVTFIALLLVGFIIENSLAKKSSQNIAERFESKRKNFMTKILSIKEFILLLPGLVLGIVGFLGFWIKRNIIDTFPEDFFSSLEITFIFLIAIGALFIISPVFLLLTRLIRLLWQIIGKYAWKKRKSYFTLLLKHLSIYSNNYIRTIFVMFMICLAITPGFIVTKSAKDHIPIEANLRTGCADIIVYDWDPENNYLKNSISSIEGVNLVTGISFIQLRDLNFQRHFENKFDITLINIHNATEYAEIFDNSLQDRLGYSSNDIEQLEQNMTYMMSEKFARRNKYNKDEIFLSSKFTSLEYTPYEMKYINSFEYFPLIRRSSDSSLINRDYDCYDIATSNLTVSQLLPRLDDFTENSTSHMLLVSVSENANVTKIQDTIKSITSLRTDTKEAAMQFLQRFIDEFQISFFIVVSIIAMFALLFFGYITAKNTYFSKLRIIESEYNVGAEKQQIWNSFTIEFVLIILIPVLLSSIISYVLLYNFLGYLIGAHDDYIKFKAWQPFWLYILIILLSLALVTAGWLLEIVNQVNKFRPTKQE